MPEPHPTDAPAGERPADDLLEFADDISIAFLLLLERLAPVERAAFLLHEVFETSYDDIAIALDRSPQSLRQIVARARIRIVQRRRRFRSTADQQQALAQRFEHALVARDSSALAELFHADAELTADGGAETLAARKPIRGAARIVHFLVTLATLRPPAKHPLRFVWLNGTAGFIVLREGKTFATLGLEFDGARIARLYITRNPEKLRRVHDLCTVKESCGGARNPKNALHLGIETA